MSISGLIFGLLIVIGAIAALGEKPLAWVGTEYELGLQKQWQSDVNTLKRLPSTQPEQIRCKDCKHRPMATRAEEQIYWGFSVEFPDDVCPLQCEDGWYNHYPNDDFYCGKAERREE